MSWTTLTLIVAFSLLLPLEGLFPLRKRSRSRRRRWTTNLCIAGLAVATSAVLVQPAMHGSLEFRFGLLHLVAWPSELESLAALLLLDLTFYYWHRALHRFPSLWRFHAVHHSDPDLDLSTAYRFHFGEILLSTLPRAAQVALIGLSHQQLLAYSVVYQVAVMLHHGNLRLPERWEGLLGRVVVTPRMHGVHHSRAATHANSNYGVVLSVWDRLHSTFVSVADATRLRMGVPAFSRERDHQLLATLVQPFRRQPSPWRSPEPAASSERAPR